MGDVTVEDRILIREVYDRYHWALNTGDGEALLACFVPDGRGRVLKFDGTTSTAESMAAGADAWQADPVNGTRQHHIGTFLVDPDPDGHEQRRAVRSYFLVTEVSAPPAVAVRWSCFSRDAVEKVDGRWHILHRAITLNHPGTA